MVLVGSNLEVRLTYFLKSPLTSIKISFVETVGGAGMFLIEVVRHIKGTYLHTIYLLRSTHTSGLPSR